jgi:hypothetical protein
MAEFEQVGRCGLDDGAVIDAKPVRAQRGHAPDNLDVRHRLEQPRNRG